METKGSSLPYCMLKAGALHFAVVVGTGFVLGPIRVLWLVPHFGEGAAELIEAPIMLIVIGVAARWIARRHAALPTPSIYTSRPSVFSEGFE